MPDTNSYLYNARSEFTSATAAVDANYHYSYQYDPIGNRESSSERGTNTTYAATELNQYTAVDDFVPQFDLDGNQTLVKTATGIWQITYNGENRPVRWAQGDVAIAMSFDRIGRRVTKNNQHFVYDGYLQIADNLGNTYIWDCTENVATRPFVWMCGFSVAYYTHDGNKNVSEVIADDGFLAAHYEYAPFGANSAVKGAFAATNPWRFSCECAEDEIGCDYYNYRHYDHMAGRWLNRDPIGESGGANVYFFCDNAISVDFIGLVGVCDDLGVMCDQVWPAPPDGWAAEAERQRLERERKKTEDALPDISIVIGVSGTRNFPVGGGWGISIISDISFEFGTCCDKEKKTKNFRKLIGKISAGPYAGIKPLIVPPSLKPPEFPLGYVGECPEPGESYDGFLSFQFSAGGPYVGCSYSFKKRKREWSCGSGFVLEKIAQISVDVGGGVSYEVVTVY